MQKILSLDFGMDVAGEVDREGMRLAQVSYDHSSVPSSFCLKEVKEMLTSVLGALF